MVEDISDTTEEEFSFIKTTMVNKRVKIADIKAGKFHMIKESMENCESEDNSSWNCYVNPIQNEIFNNITLKSFDD